jgi:ATP-dependent Clp protease adaptor protein ClpS
VSTSSGEGLIAQVEIEGSLTEANRMAEKKPKKDGDKSSAPTGTATAKPKRATRTVPKLPPPQMLPPWKVLLHNDDKNSRDFVVDSIVELTPLNKQDAELRMKEADDTGVALLLTTHKERAELYKDQFESKGLTVTIEPAEK